MKDSKLLTFKFKFSHLSNTHVLGKVIENEHSRHILQELVFVLTVFLSVHPVFRIIVPAGNLFDTLLFLLSTKIK